MRSRVSCRTVAVFLAFGLPASAIRAEEASAQPAAAPVSQGTTAPPASSTEEEIQALRREIEDLKNQIQVLRGEVRGGLPSGQPDAAPAPPPQVMPAAPAA